MRNRANLLIAATSVLGMASFASSALGDVPTLNPDVAYSAKRVISSGEGRMEQRYFQRDASTNRMELHVNGEYSVAIMNGDRGVIMLLMPAQQLYMEGSSAGRAFDETNVELPDPETWEMERVGRESVNGVPATKYRVATDGGEVTRMRGFIWVSDHGIPVRTDMVTGNDRIQMELSDLVVGPQPASLFEPPAGYQRIAPGEGMAIGSGDLTRGAMGSDAGSAETGFVEELASEATEEVKRTTQEEVRETVRDSVRKGLRKIFPGN
jgi:hypothetical protein